jgi:predicted HTH transcriptional regulator
MIRDIGNIVKKREGQVIEFKNPNIPNGRGPIDPDNFIPCPKNPTICKFMIQLGRFDELGSGVMNVNRYLPFYTKGARPEFIEGEMFSVVVPVDGEEFLEAEKKQPLLSQSVSGPESLVDSRILKILNNPK